MKKNWLCYGGVLAGLLCFFLCVPCINAEEKKEEKAKEDKVAEFTLEEIVVTAERRSTSIMDTPTAVSALSGNAIDEEGLGGIVDLQMRMPSTSLGGNVIYMRGIGRALDDLGTDVSVGVFYDGAYNEYLTFLDQMVDVERVETVRGPQSTMYGRNTIGGAINVIFNKPKKEFEGQLRARIGNYNLREFTGVLNVPLVGEWLLGRFTFMDTYYGGHVKNLTYDEYVGTTDDWKTDFKVLYQPNDMFSVYLQYKIYYAYGTNSNAVDYVTEFENKDQLVTSYTFNTGYGISNPNLNGENPYVSIVDRIGTTSLDHKEWSLAMDLDLEKFVFKYNTFYRWWYRIEEGDYDGFPCVYGEKYAYNDYNAHSTSQEFQMLYGGSDTRFSLLAGLYYFATTKFYGVEIFDRGPAFWEYGYDMGSFVADPDSKAYEHKVDLENHSYSGYANIDFDLTDKLTLSGGYRYAIDTKWTGEDVIYAIKYSPIAKNTPNTSYQAAMGITDPDDKLAGLDPDSDTYELDRHLLGYYFGTTLYDLAPIWYKLVDDKSIKGEWDAHMWKVGFDYKPSSKSMIYFGISRGYKPGGLAIDNDGGELYKFDPEFLLAYETGWKQSWMDDRVNTTISAYFYDFDGYQLSYLDPYYDFEGELRYQKLTTNATGITNHGIEFEGAAYLTKALKVDWQYSWLVAEYADFWVYDRRYQTAVNLKGERMIMSPEHKFTVGATYTYPTNIGDFVLHGTYNWNDETTYSMISYEDSWAKPWDRIDAELMWFSQDRKWRITLWGKNLMDKPSLRYVDALYYDGTKNSDGAVTPGDVRRIRWRPIDPLQFGVTVSFKW